MKIAIIIALVALVGMASANNDNVEMQFMSFMKKFNRQYESLDEFHARFANFKATLARIEDLKVKNPSAKFAVNKFSDMAPEEFSLKMKGYVAPLEKPRVSAVSSLSATPTKVDWRQKGVITPVKDQQQCGSCWAFSATETIESYWIKAGNSATELSPQQIVSCDTNDYGCDGGWPSSAYQYIISAGGQESDSAYPYTSGGGDSGTCNFDASGVVATISGWQYSETSGNETNLANQIAAVGPMSVCVDASSWQDYSGGVLTDCTDNIDHCVQAVGFDQSGSQPYWIVRNSWGADWGENGYIYVEIGQDLCAIATEATYVTV